MFACVNSVRFDREIARGEEESDVLDLDVFLNKRRELDGSNYQQHEDSLEYKFVTLFTRFIRPNLSHICLTLLKITQVKKKKKKLKKKFKHKSVPFFGFNFYVLSIVTYYEFI